MWLLLKRKLINLLEILRKEIYSFKSQVVNEAKKEDKMKTLILLLSVAILLMTIKNLVQRNRVDEIFIAVYILNLCVLTINTMILIASLYTYKNILIYSISTVIMLIVIILDTITIVKSAKEQSKESED